MFNALLYMKKPKLRFLSTQICILNTYLLNISTIKHNTFIIDQMYLQTMVSVAFVTVNKEEQLLTETHELNSKTQAFHYLNLTLRRSTTYILT